jgi:hypothetical protein
MTTSHAGTDYGSGLTNIDTKTGIRFGVIPQNDVLQAWADSSEPVYTYCCPHCGTELKKGSEAKRCPSCYKKIDADRDFAFQEPDGFILDDGEYMCTCDEYGDIFILKSPYVTYAAFCSPCAPGACHLRSELDDKNANNRTYCLGHDFFEEGTAPYTVYDAETGEIVKPTPQ